MVTGSLNLFSIPGALKMAFAFAPGLMDLPGSFRARFRMGMANACAGDGGGTHA
ncbi:hypothetical protein FHS01_002255 [Longimicrobium terrae]|uniref:Uncharacterized protein n=1 Tax=Longimicrobium terrae TaxID=1639882 RepID=A0A841GY09_9BACT|nr:hypothetical protein [Longimicrobium terrae]MBB6070632.1 hypothetical protein [Longimicrobium terrae]